MTQFVMYKIALCAHDKKLFLNLKTITAHCNIEGTNNYVHCKYVVII